MGWGIAKASWEVKEGWGEGERPCRPWKGGGVISVGKESNLKSRRDCLAVRELYVGQWITRTSTVKTVTILLKV